MYKILLTTAVVILYAATSICQSSIIVSKDGTLFNANIDSISQEKVYYNIIKGAYKYGSTIDISKVACVVGYPFNLLSQSGNDRHVYFEHVIDSTGKAKEILKDLVKGWIAETFQSQEAVITGESDNLVSGTIAFKSIVRKKIIFEGPKAYWCSFRGNVLFKFKDDKVRFTLDDLTYNWATSPSNLYFDFDKAYRTEEGVLAEEYYKIMVDGLSWIYTDLFNSLKKYIKNNGDNDNW